ncbi:MAG TPA: CRTAC1 family protein [Terriglobales bacterium]|nr:CRTAC1 family protein [Terriglobales bacterium]
MRRSYQLAVFLLAALASVPVAPAQTKPSEPALPVFEDISTKIGINFKHEASLTSQKYLIESMGPGVALFDYDNDGRLDIFVVNGAYIADPMPTGALPDKKDPRYWNRLYHQRPDGSFEDVTVKAGLAGSEYGMGVAVGDYDNDGFEDLYVTGYPRNRLYKNNGNGTFTDVTDAAGVAGSGWSVSATFVDYNNDGRLDLFVTRYLDWSFDKNIFCGEHRPGYRAYCHPDSFPPATNLLFRNDGKGKFTDVSKEAGIAVPGGKSLGVALGDYDGDGNIDIFVANDSVREFLLHNRGHGIFEEVGLESGAAVDEDGHVFAGMGVDFADYDNDCRPDIVIGDLANQMYPLYRNEGDGTFSYATHSSGLGKISMLSSGWGLRLFDYDNDGWKDLFVGQGHVLDTIELTQPNLQYRQRPLMARNNGKGFVDVSAQSGLPFQQRWSARGVATGDIDNDGNVDVVVGTNNGSLYVLRNRGANANHWITLALTGTTSNRDAIGAQVRLVSATGRQQCAMVTTSSSYASASDKRIHFGLGSDESARSIQIRWPSGLIQILPNVKADQSLVIKEPRTGSP